MPRGKSAGKNCRVCGEVCYNKFPQHLMRNHGITEQEHFDQYLKKEGDGLCKMCGRITTFYHGKYNPLCSHSCKMEYRWANHPEYQQQMSQVATEVFKKSWKNPEVAARWKKRFSDIVKDQWKDPEYAAKIVQGKRDWWSEFFKDPKNVLMDKEWRTKLSMERAVDPDDKWGKLHQPYSGVHDSPKAGKIFYGSGWELNACKIWDADETVVSYERGPIIPYFWPEGESHSYMSDFLVTYTNGSKRIIEVKRDFEKHTGESHAKFLAACRYSKEIGYLPFKVWDSKYVRAVNA